MGRGGWPCLAWLGELGGGDWLRLGDVNNGQHTPAPCRSEWFSTLAWGPVTTFAISSDNASRVRKSAHERTLSLHARRCRGRAVPLFLFPRLIPPLFFFYSTDIFCFVVLQQPCSASRLTGAWMPHARAAC